MYILNNKLTKKWKTVISCYSFSIVILWTVDVYWDPLLQVSTSAIKSKNNFQVALKIHTRKTGSQKRKKKKENNNWRIKEKNKSLEKYDQKWKTCAEIKLTGRQTRFPSHEKLAKHEPGIYTLMSVCEQEYNDNLWHHSLTLPSLKTCNGLSLNYRYRYWQKINEYRKKKSLNSHFLVKILGVGNQFHAWLAVHSPVPHGIACVYKRT